MAQQGSEVGLWKTLGNEFKSAFCRPWKYPKYFGYFLFVVCIVGGWGIWDPILKFWCFGTIQADQYPPLFFGAVYTYFIAIAAAAVLDIAISPKFSDSFKLYSHIAGFIVFVCGLIVSFGSIKIAGLPALIGYILSLLLWWIANSHNDHLFDKPISQQAAMGGDPEQELPGNLSDFRGS